MGSCCSREGFDLFDKRCHRAIRRNWKQILTGKNVYFWKDTFSRFIRPFCKHKNKKLFNEDGKDDYYCPDCMSWIK